MDICLTTLVFLQTDKVSARTRLSQVHAFVKKMYIFLLIKQSHELVFGAISMS